MDWLTNTLTTLVLPVIAGPLTFWVSEKTQAASVWLGKQPAITKQIATAALSAAVTAGGAQVAQLFPSGVVSVENLSAQAVTAWALSMATHGLVKSRARKRQVKQSTGSSDA